MINNALTRYGNAGLFDDWLFNQAFRDTITRAVKPNVDVIDTEKSVTIVTDSPGYDAKDINISIEDGVLTVSGKRTLEKNEEGKTFTKRERTEESFSRSFTINEQLDSAKIKATLNNGVLKVEIPKIAKTVKSPTKIVVEQV